jgi:hypothetical protein
MDGGFGELEYSYCMHGGCLQYYLVSSFQGHPADVVATQYLFYTTCVMSQGHLVVTAFSERHVTIRHVSDL